MMKLFKIYKIFNADFRQGLRLDFERKFHARFSLLFRRDFFTFHFRPKAAIDLKSKSLVTIKEKDLAIVMQGPLHLENDYTLETLKAYGQLFPGATVILSTWKNLDARTKSEIGKLKYVLVLENDPPKKGGPFNINFQIVSTAAGMLKAQEMGFRYCIKTRTDQRLYHYDLFPFLEGLLTTFPLKENIIQKQRLITCSWGTCKFRIYGISDFFMFGTTLDMVSYWTTPLYEEGIKIFLSHTQQLAPPIINGTPVISEMYLGASYLKRFNPNLDWNLESYWNYLRDYFCVVDASMLDLTWDKYLKLKEFRYTREYDQSQHRAFEFSDWLNLYHHKDLNWSALRPVEKWTKDANNNLILLNQ